MERKIRRSSAKAALYADAGVPEYWVINVARREIEVRSEPREGRYARLTTPRSGDRVCPMAYSDVVLEVDEVLPARA